MRDDFNKLLVERERVHSKDHYHNYRNVRGPKGLTDDEVGGREAMRSRYNHGYDRKQFNENLNPLYGWLRSIVGKKWDKCYNEMCSTFDMRGVINSHILEHLYQSLEVHAFLNEAGAVVAQRGFTVGGKASAHGDPVPISRCGKDYYVCPKDGTVKRTNKAPRRSVIKEKEAQKQREKLAVERFLDPHNVLRLIDGVWYHFELKEIPTVRVIYVKPTGTDEFFVGWSRLLGQQTARLTKTWDELNEQERVRFGRTQISGGTARDLFTNEVVYRDQKGLVYFGARYLKAKFITASSVYHATKKTANHKQLKQAGIAV